MAVLSSNDLYSSHFSVMGWVELILLCHKKHSWRLVQIGMYYMRLNVKNTHTAAWAINFGDYRKLCESMLIVALGS